MISCARWEKRLQRLEKRLKIPKIEFIICVVDMNRKVIRRFTLGPNSVELPLEDDEDPKETSPVPTTSAQKTPGEMPDRSEGAVNELDKQHAEPTEIPPAPPESAQKAPGEIPHRFSGIYSPARSIPWPGLRGGQTIMNC